MSAEGKKRRGESGKANAEASPFRLNGFAADWQARRAGVYQNPASISGGSTFMRGMVGGALVEAMGFGASTCREDRMAHATSRCTHPMLTI